MNRNIQKIPKTGNELIGMALYNFRFCRLVSQQLKAQSFAKMSAVIMREMLEDVMSEQCQEIAVITRKEIVRQKKAMLGKKAEILRRNQLRRYFQT